MMKMLFFFMGVPLMIMSFFQVQDVLPYANQLEIISNGNIVVLSQEQQDDLMQEIKTLLADSHTVPAFGVVFDDMYQQEIQSGNFVSIKFANVCEINGLPFDQLVFKVEKDWQGFNLMRGENGHFQGRCIYVDLMGKNMQNLAEKVEILSKNANAALQVDEEKLLPNDKDFATDQTLNEKESVSEN